MVFPTAVGQVPPGYRFHPTDEELIAYYLSNKVLGKRILGDAVAELDIYDSAPWDLPELGSLRNRNLIGYFFCPRRERRGKRGRARRRTKSGYWKSTGEDRPVLRYGRRVGKRKTLIFHLGKSGEGERTNWVMYEFRLEDTQLDGVVRDSYVLCKIFEKSGPGPQNGEQYGAPFNEKEWEDNNETQGIPVVERLPPGYRFYPTDEELIFYYLKKKVLGESILGDAVSELDIYDFSPWDLPELGSLRNRNLIAYFFCPRRERRGKSGKESRLTESGYWKITGEGKKSVLLLRNIKSLIFYLGKSRKGKRTNWVMHEYRLVDTQPDGVDRDSYVLCKIFKKSGRGPKNGEQYGAPFNEKEWEDNNETQGIPASTSPTEGPSNCNNLEDSAVTGILVPGHHYSGIVASSREPVSLENGALSSVELPDPNAYRDVVPIPEGPQGQSTVFVFDDEISLEEVLEPYSNRTDAGMLAHVSGQDQVVHDPDNRLDAGVVAHGTDQDEVMQDADSDDLFSGLNPLEELYYPSRFNRAGYAPEEAYPAGDFLEQRDLVGVLSSLDLPDPNACRNVVPIPEGPQDQYTACVLSFEELLEPSSNLTDASMLAHVTGQDQVMQDADFDGVFGGLSPLLELDYPSPFNKAGYAPQEADPAGDFLEQRDLDNLLSPLSAPQGAAPADDFLEQRDLDNWFSP